MERGTKTGNERRSLMNGTFPVTQRKTMLQMTIPHAGRVREWNVSMILLSDCMYL